MKFWKHAAFSALAFVAIAGTVTFTACERDSCLDLTCKFGGTCAEGFCRCRTGYEGTECEILTGEKFVGFYVGNVKCGNNPPLKDTLEIFWVSKPDKLMFVQHSRITDTLYGVANKLTADIPEVSFGDYRRSFNVVAGSNNKLTFNSEEILNLNTGDRNVCQFIGFK